MTRAAGVSDGDRLAIEFADATLDAVAGDAGKASRRRPRTERSDTEQFDLF